MQNENNPLDLTPLVASNTTKHEASTEEKTGGRGCAEPSPASPCRLGRTLAFTALLLVILGAGTAGWLSAHHIIQTEDGTAILRKRYLTFANTTVDIRQWDHQTFQANPTLTKAMQAQGYGDLVKQPPVVSETPKGTLDTVKEWGAIAAEKAAEAGTATVDGLTTAGRATADHARYVVDFWSEQLDPIRKAFRMLGLRGWGRGECAFAYHAV